VQGRHHILSIGGDALRDGKYQTNHLIINRVVVFLSANKKASLEQTQNGWSQDALLRTLFLHTIICLNERRNDNLGRYNIFSHHLFCMH
jgi:hypothetical protein